jgi:hypothetical protein
MVWSVELVNVGSVTAKDTMAVFDNERMRGLRINNVQSDVWFPYNRTDGQEFVCNRPLHPGRVTPVFIANWVVEAKPSAALGQRVVPHIPAASF